MVNLIVLLSILISANLTLLLIPVCWADPRRNQWSKQVKEIKISTHIFGNILYSLVIIQVSAIYFHSVFGKLGSEQWLNGTCLYYWFTNNIYGAPQWSHAIIEFLTLTKFTTIFSWIILLTELGLFACIFATNLQIRKLFLILGISLHFFIALTHGLTLFFLSMLGALILYLDDKNFLLNFLIKLKNKIL